MTEAISRFLNLNPLILPHQNDLIRYYNPGAEVQVNVLPGDGVPSEDGKSYSDATETWFPIRIPKNARTVPEFRDWELRWTLQNHAECIGMTGWNFEKRLSMHVGFDFDAICGNSHLQSGISQEELDRVRAAAQSIPWVETRRSTGGGGLHLRVHLGAGIPTANHTEHAALGRAILGLMSRETGFDFLSRVDPAACGGNLWIWHRKVTAENRGLELITPATDVPDVPENWRDHVDVIRGRRRKVRVQGVPDSAQDDLAAKSEASKQVPLDDQHKALMDWLIENGYTCVWEPEHSMLRTHTYALALAHDALGLRGFFKTLATGSDGRGDHNCFCFNKPNGAWRIVRYGEGCLEADTWIQDGADWTYCYLNQQPDLKTAALAKGGVKDDDGGFVFPSLTVAADVAGYLGARLDVTELLKDRQTKLKPAKDGAGLVVEVKREKGDDAASGFIDKKTTFKKVISAILPEPDLEVRGFDNEIRYLKTPAPKVEDAGWVVKIQGDWCEQPKDNVISALMSKGMTSADAKAATGSILYDAWTLANLPFKAEFPGGRIWNRYGAQFAFPIADEDGDTPHWDLIYNHVGSGLNDAMVRSDWCKDRGLRIGGDYLRLHSALMFQRPRSRKPYLFFYSEAENTGKSSYHQATGMLMTKGYVKADSALTNQQGFNGELEGAILCVVEETDLSKRAGETYDRIKDWTTSPHLKVHRKFGTPYMTDNTTSWVQCANKLSACPIFDGNTRIVAIEVPPIDNEIPWEQLELSLREEAPAL